MATSKQDVNFINTRRYQNIQKQFVEIFGEKSQYFVRAPGRVNLIGEHIDYCGYAVLPMAIEQDVVIAVSTNSDKILRIHNTDSKYQNYSCPTTEIKLNDVGHLDWYHYFLCGFKGVVDYINIQEPIGMNAVVCGNVPQNSGLSSSSALVCSVALATAHCNDKNLSKEKMCKITAVCETYLGLDDGGMDQAIAFLAEPGIAKLIDFDPITSTDVRLPKDAVFVVANSCVEINKAATTYFNTRVAECRLAAQVIAKTLKLIWQEIRTLKDLHKALDMPLDEMVDVVKDNLHKDAYSKTEICHLLNVSSYELNHRCLSNNIKNVNEFKLFDRATHVYKEARRVLTFKSLCDQVRPDVFQELGKVMSESHDSCRDLYECSCTELDELVNLSRKSGAFGSRLTGAGWGGCTVSLVPAQNVAEFIHKMNIGFYQQNPKRKCLDLSKVLFATSPGAGARVVENGLCNIETSKQDTQI